MSPFAYTIRTFPCSGLPLLSSPHTPVLAICPTGLTGLNDKWFTGLVSLKKQIMKYSNKAQSILLMCFMKNEVKLFLDG